MNWQDILKKNIEEEILEEVEDEGGALGMKNLKDIADEETLEATLSEMEDDGKIFEHVDGDFYTHEPKREAEKEEEIEKKSGYKPANPSLWQDALAYAKRTYDVYPSAYANAGASKWYKKKGGTWRKE